VAVGNGKGNKFNQISNSHGLYIDDHHTVYIVDSDNYRIAEWKIGATSGQVVADGNRQGSRNNQLSSP